MKKSPLRGIYLVRYPGISSILRGIDFFLSWKKKPVKVDISAPKRILLSNLAHLGDVVNATAVLPVLKSAFPKVRIGFIIGSWSKDLLENHPLIDDFYIVDHWKFNRAKISFFKKVLHYFKGRSRALEEIKKNHYDVAIDLYYYFGNSLPLLKKAGIPVRIGYTSGGYGPFLTHAFNWNCINQSVIKHYIPLLRVLPLRESDLEKLETNLAPVSVDTIEDLYSRFPSMQKPYIVMHPGSGALFKEWPLNMWQQLFKECSDRGFLVIVTGHGKREFERAESIIEGSNHAFNYVNKFTLKEFIAVLFRAKVLIGVDSAAGHIASAVKTKTILLYPGINHSKEWIPQVLDKEFSKILQHPVNCAPCFRRKGCKAMHCIRNIASKEVLEHILPIMKELS